MLKASSFPEDIIKKERKMTISEYKKLCKEIELHSKAYYDKDTPVITYSQTDNAFISDINDREFPRLILK